MARGQPESGGPRALVAVSQHRRGRIRNREKGGLAKGVSAESSVTPKETENAIRTKNVAGRKKTVFCIY